MIRQGEKYESHKDWYMNDGLYLEIYFPVHWIFLPDKQFDQLAVSMQYQAPEPVFDCFGQRISVQFGF